MHPAKNEEEKELRERKREERDILAEGKRLTFCLRSLNSWLIDFKRQKNNLAAKRSRESKRARDNKIVDTANLLEKENSFLKEQIFRVR